MSVKKSDPVADMSALESENDQMVYKLYGLTKEEFNRNTPLDGQDSACKKRPKNAKIMLDFYDLLSVNCG